MKKIAVYTNKDLKLCDFFESERVLIYEKKGCEKNWEKTSEADFKKIIPSTPAVTRTQTEAVLPLIEDCSVLAGGGLYGIPFTVFDRAKLHIFEIKEINDRIFDSIIEDIDKADIAAARKESIIKNTKPVETETPGVYFLDLIALQKECPEVTSKKAMMDFLNDTPFMELRLVCKHIPPWIENSGAFNIETIKSENETVTALITKKC